MKRSKSFFCIFSKISFNNKSLWLGTIGKLDFSKIKSPKISSQNDLAFKLTSSALIRTNESETHLIKYKDLKEKKFLGSGEFGYVKCMIHEPTNLKFAVKVYYYYYYQVFILKIVFWQFIRENIIESNENRNSSLMDIEVSVKLGNGCSNLVRFYGAIYADVAEI